MTSLLHNVRLSSLTKEDCAVCTNYLTEEYERLGGTVTYNVSGKFYAGISHADIGYKVEVDGVIVAFVALSIHRGVVTIVNFFVNSDFRFTCVFYLISNSIKAHVQDAVKIVYLPMRNNMTLPYSVCADGVINKEAYLAKLIVLEKRWKNG